MTKIYGSSDDQIIVEGGILNEETYVGYEGYIGLSSGSLYSFRYDNDGIWRFCPVVIADDSKERIFQCSLDDENGAYSDVLETEDDLLWVMAHSDVIKE